MLQDGEQPQIRRRTRAMNGINTEMPQELQNPLPRTRRQSGTAPETDAVYPDDDLDIGYPSHTITNSSVVRYTSPQGIPQTRRTGNQTSAVTGTRRQPGTKLQPSQRQPRSSATPAPVLEKLKPGRHPHWMFYIGVGMLAALVLWLLGSSVVNWGQRVYNDWHYGYPRTFQTDAVVGHNKDSAARPSHFIAVNLNRQVIVMEIPAGDPSKSISYVVPIYITGSGGDLAPVTLEFRDVNGDHKPDMIIHVWLSGQNQVFVFINDGTKFRPSTGNDHISI